MEESLSASRVVRNTGKANPQWIVWGNGRRLAHNWATVWGFAVDHGWAFVRIGNNLVGYPADVTEGHA